MVPKESWSAILKILQEATKDEQRDVRYAAVEALKMAKLAISYKQTLLGQEGVKASLARRRGVLKTH